MNDNAIDRMKGTSGINDRIQTVNYCFQSWKLICFIEYELDTTMDISSWYGRAAYKNNCIRCIQNFSPFHSIDLFLITRLLKPQSGSFIRQNDLISF